VLHRNSGSSIGARAASPSPLPLLDAGRFYHKFGLRNPRSRRGRARRLLIPGADGMGMGAGIERIRSFARMGNPLVLVLPLLDRGLRQPELFKIRRASRRGSGEGEDFQASQGPTPPTTQNFAPHPVYMRWLRRAATTAYTPIPIDTTGIADVGSRSAWLRLAATRLTCSPRLFDNRYRENPIPVRENSN